MIKTETVYVTSDNHRFSTHTDAERWERAQPRVSKMEAEMAQLLTRATQSTFVSAQKLVELLCSDDGLAVAKLLAEVHMVHGHNGHSLDEKLRDEKGLGLCTICGGAEASMPTNCPGRQMTEMEMDAVQANLLDYRDGGWRTS